MHTYYIYHVVPGIHVSSVSVKKDTKKRLAAEKAGGKTLVDFRLDWQYKQLLKGTERLTKSDISVFNLFQDLFHLFIRVLVPRVL